MQNKMKAHIAPALGIAALALAMVVSLAVLSLAGCTNPADTELAIIDIATIEGVTAPAAGAEPVTAITPTKQFTGTVAWKPAVADTFAANTAYTATITLTAKTGYTLEGVPANFFKVKDVSKTTKVTNAAGTGVITVAFPKTGKVPNQTPVEDDYAVGNLNQTVGGITPVTVTAQEGKSTGAVTVLYNNSPSLPRNAGTYEITFNVAAASGWNAASGLSAGTLIINKGTPIADDFTIAGIEQYDYDRDNSVEIVIITAKSGKSTGEITIKYNGSETIPTAPGSYTVTFDVEADPPNWNAAGNLSAGTLIIPVPQDPAAGDFTVGKLTQYVGAVGPVSVSPKAGKSRGAITVYYNGSATLPTALGTYTVTFDAAAAPGWYAARGLSAGLLTVAEPSDPAAEDFTVGNLAQVRGRISAVTITPKSGKSNGARTIYYDDSTTLPQTTGEYAVTFDVAAALANGWKAAAGLSAGTLVIIDPPSPAAGDFTVDNLTQIAGKVTAVAITAKAGKSPGTVTVYYDGSPAIPQTAGNYAVTFNVADAAASGWNSAAGLNAGTLTVLPSGTAQIVYFWIDEHDELAAGGAAPVGGVFTVASGNGITFTAQDYDSSNQYRWILNGADTGTAGETYTFAEKAIGKHVVGLFVQKDGKWYNTNFNIVVQQ